MSNLKTEFVSKFSLIAICAFVVLVAGCSRCQECDYSSSSETICETEFDNTAQYEDAITDAEASGANCTSSAGF